MPAKRRTSKRAEYPITPEVLAAYRSGDDRTLRELWNLKPWQWPSPAECVGECPYPAGCGGAEWWPLGVELRLELEAADAC
ncbi:hypothetical protein ACWPM1_07660 [Tsuneonella sp. HG249]